ncbi:MAG: 2-oxoglutarate dehydrogenase E1 component [Alphaproteobacteria bacterium]|nr:2-oxoglutarate dehydrogenase E1 component [Alphaproteobacteria bacterium]
MLCRRSVTAIDFHETTFLSGTNAPFIAELYSRYLVDPSSVDESWRRLFAELADEQAVVEKDLAGPGWGRIGPRLGEHAGVDHGANGRAIEAGHGASDSDAKRAADDTAKVVQLIRSYRARGHLLCNLDPLGLTSPTGHADLDPATYGFGEADYDRPIRLGSVLGPETASLRQIMATLRAAYSDRMGIEYMHIDDQAQRQWLQDAAERVPPAWDLSADDRRMILSRLTAADTLEQFLAKKYPGATRFGIEGGEVLIPALEEMALRGVTSGLREMAIGIAHRGRLNLLANVLNVSAAAVFAEFQGTPTYPDGFDALGDVKYHIGASADRQFDGHSVHLSLVANPSHLEAVDPVVLGKVRAKQRQRAGVERVVGVLVHGDGAIAGQGIVMEALQLSGLPGYQTGGTIHVVLNNQIGFTTGSSDARSTRYASDVGKMFQAPIFHVSGDDPDSVVRAARIATDFRQTFRKDVVIDLLCYRRHGHNEGDEPAFTQPSMYQAIKAHPTTRQIYAQRLAGDGLVTDEQAAKMVSEVTGHLESQFQAAKSYRSNKADWLEGEWAGLRAAPGGEGPVATAVSLELLKEVGVALTAVPAGFHLNPKIARQLSAKRTAIETGVGIDWATGEALAFGTLCAEGSFVRLSGQDTVRGTFAQRHAVLIDQETEERYAPLNHVRAGQAPFEVLDSPLSEAAVLGFEYGFSLADPSALVLWEAQYGDFANGAQTIIDQFVTSGEVKWLRMSGLVLLLPHGFEGQGPDHSTGRPERFLQLCAEDNIQVCNLTTAANYFHALRRQVRREYRKPLIVMTPKSLLRNAEVASRLEDMGPGSSFRSVIGETDDLVADADVKRVILCSGKIYFELRRARRERKLNDIAIVRLEQLYPFPADALRAMLQRYPKAEFVWCQEEPENMGAWEFVDRRMRRLFREMPKGQLRYVGRSESAAPATGYPARHTTEQTKVITDALA